jgi:hypothetical protein
MAAEATVRVTVLPGRTLHLGDHAFGEGETLSLPAAHAAELIAAGSVREADPA